MKFSHLLHLQSKIIQDVDYTLGPYTKFKTIRTTHPYMGLFLKEIKLQRIIFEQKVVPLKGIFSNPAPQPNKILAKRKLNEPL